MNLKIFLPEELDELYKMNGSDHCCQPRRLRCVRILMDAMEVVAGLQDGSKAHTVLHSIFRDFYYACISCMYS